MDKYLARTHREKTVLSVALLLIIFAVIFSIAFVGGFETGAYAAAADVENGTLLATGQGLSLGNNYLRTTNNQASSRVYSSAANTADSRYGDDFYFDLTTSDWNQTAADGSQNVVGYDSSGFYINYFTDSTDVVSTATSFSFVSKIKLTDGGSLAAALRSSYGSVTANLTFSYQTYNSYKASGTENESDGYQDIFDFDCDWSQDGIAVSSLSSGSATVQSSANTVTRTFGIAKAGESADYDNAFLQLSLGNFRTLGSDMVTVNGESKPSTGIFIRFFDFSISIVNNIPGTTTMFFNSSGVKIEENGTTRIRSDADTIYSKDSEVYFEQNIINALNTDYTLSQEDVYVKFGDTVFLYSDVFVNTGGTESTRMHLAPDYAASVNSTGKAIQWKYTDNTYYQMMNNLGLQDYSNTADQQTGRTTIYKVNYAASSEGSERELIIRPEIISSYSYDDVTGEYTYNTVTVDANKYTKIYFDNVAPSAPIIDTSQGLGLYGYDTAIYGNIAEQNIVRRYTDSLKIGFYLDSSYSLYTTTGTAKAPENVYYTVNGQNPSDASSTRYKATFSNSGLCEIDLNTEENGGVGSGAGFYEIKLVTIDAAGNYSDVVSYRLVADNSEYNVKAQIVGGLSTTAKDNPIDFNQAGTGNVATVFFSNPNTSQMDRRNNNNYKRGSEVTIRVEMTAAQRAKYQLVAIYNGVNGNSGLTWGEDDIVWRSLGSNLYAFDIVINVDKYVEPELTVDGNVQAFTVTDGDDLYYVYEGNVYSAQYIAPELKIGTFEYATGVMKIGTAYYYVDTEEGSRAFYSLARDAGGRFVYMGNNYSTTLIGTAVIDIEGTTVNLLTPNAAREFYFAFKQRVDVAPVIEITTFSYTAATATTAAVADAKNIVISPIPAASLVNGGREETFAGIVFDVRYYYLSTVLYSTIAELKSDMSLAEALALGYVLPVLDNNSNPTAPTSAGSYWYTATISELSGFNSDYYYSAEGVFEVRKASPGVSGVIFGTYSADGVLSTKHLTYGSGGLSTMDSSILGLDEQGSYSDSITTLGVQGSYRISTATTDYDNPDAGQKEVSIIFTPSAVNSHGNGKYAILNADNIDSVSVRILLIVDKAKVAISVDETSLVKEYNGSGQRVSATVRLHQDLGYMAADEVPNAVGSTIRVNNNLILDTSDFSVTYKFRAINSSEFTLDVPRNAGFYDVQISIEAKNFIGSAVLSDHYFTDVQQGYYADEKFYFVDIDNNAAEILPSSSTVSRAVGGFVFGGIRYYIAGDSVWVYNRAVGDPDEVIVTYTEDGIYSVSARGRSTEYYLGSALEEVSFAISTASYLENTDFYYRTCWTIGGVEFYLDNGKLYSDVRATVEVGSYDEDGVITIGAVSYRLIGYKMFRILAGTAKLVSVGSIADGVITYPDGKLYFDETANELYSLELSAGSLQISDAEVNLGGVSHYLLEGVVYSDALHTLPIGTYNANLIIIGTARYVIASDNSVYEVGAQTATENIIYKNNGTFDYNGESYVLTDNLIYRKMQFQIAKQVLDIEGGFAAEYDYTYYTLPTPNSAMYAYYMQMVEGENRRIKQSVNFVVEYYIENAHGEWLSVVGVDTTLFGAGNYKAVVSVAATNFRGVEEFFFSIAKVSVGNANIIVNQPGAVTIESLNAHAYYGQTLADLLLETGNSVNVQYLSAGGVLTVGVGNNYKVADRVNAIDGTVDDYDYYGVTISMANRHYADTVFDSVGEYSYNILFVPLDLENYEAFYVTLQIRIAKATPMYAGDTDEGANNWDTKLVKFDTPTSTSYVGYLTYGDTFGMVSLMSAGRRVVSNTTGSLFFYYGGVKTEVNGTFTLRGGSSSTRYNAGEYVINCRFRPTDSALFNEIEAMEITLTVVKKELTLSTSIVGAYSLPYGGNVDIISKVSNAESQRVNYIWTMYDALGVDSLTYAPTMPVGDYFIEVEVDDANYAGTLRLPMEIVKAAPRFRQKPVVSGYEWHNTLSDLDDLLNNDTALVENATSAEALTGTWAVDYDGRSYTSVKEFAVEFAALPDGTYIYSYPIFLRFTPGADYTHNYNSVTTEWTLSVERRTVSSAISFSNTSVSYTGDVQEPTATLSGVVGEFEFAYSLSPINVGNYSVTVSISSDNKLYRGARTTDFIITPRAADDLTLSFNEGWVEDGDTAPSVKWSGVATDIANVFSLTSSSLAEGTLIDYATSISSVTSLNAALLNVGKYTVSLEFRNNYSGTKSFEFTVKENNVSYTGATEGVINRVYSPDSSQTGRVLIESISPSTMSYTLQYAPMVAGVTGEWSSLVPYLAGSYRARLHFDAVGNGGYEGYDDGVEINIAKAPVTLTVTKLRDFRFGESDATVLLDECFAIGASHNSVSSYTYTYSTDAQMWQNEALIYPGDYYLKVSAENANFAGNVVYPYTIDKGVLSYKGQADATLRVETNTIYYSKYVYTAQGNDNAYFKTRNLTESFSYMGEDIGGNLVFDNRESITSLYAGTYTFGYTFTPTANGGEHGEIYYPYEGSVTLVISPLDITDHLVFDSATTNVLYSGNALDAKMRFKTAAELVADGITPLNVSNSIKAAILSSMVVYYDGSTNTPINAGVYALTTSSTHLNYNVNAVGSMTIHKAAAEIIKPEYVRLEYSADMNTTQNVNALNALSTLYAVTPTTRYVVSGTFGITGMVDAYTLNISFSPSAEQSENFSVTAATLRVVYTDSTDYINQSAIALSGISSYGAELSAVSITVGGTTSYTSVGEFRWENSSTVPPVGNSTHRLIFTPHLSNTAHYNIQAFDMTVSVGEKTTIEASDLGDLYLDVEEGRTFSDGTVIIADDRGIVFSVVGIAVNGTPMSAGTIVTYEQFRTGTIDVTLSYVSDNYVVTGDINAVAKLRLLSNSIIVSGLTQTYSGTPLTAADLYGNAHSPLTITAVNAGVAPACIITIKKDGVVTNSIDAIGSYTLSIEIDRAASNYSGTTEKIFRLTPRDLSEYIVVNNGNPLRKVYLSSYSVAAQLVGITVPSGDYEFLYYYKGADAPDTSYSMFNAPVNAGAYKLKVAVANSDYYSGEVVIDYEVTKKAVAITLNNQPIVTGGDVVVRRTYGSVSVPTLVFSDGVTPSESTVIYSKDGVLYYTVPENAGDYLATITVNATNYQGSGTFTLSIAKNTPVMTTLPTLAAIDYGTVTKNSVMSSWTASVAGTVAFVDGDRVLNAGLNAVTMRFTPDNENYNTIEFDVELTVNKAVATISFITTQIVYTGLDAVLRYNKPTYVSEEEVELYFYTLNGTALTATSAIAAGDYYVRVVVGSEAEGNYYYTNVSEDNLGNLASYQRIIIKQATALGYVVGSEPTASDIEYGNTLSGVSLLSGTVALYDDGRGGSIAVGGTYAFRNGMVPQFTVGDNQTIELVFTPSNTNYAVYYCVTTVNVKKASVAISIEDGNTLVYGERLNGISDFTFSIAQHNDLVPYLVLDNAEYIGVLLHSGGYRMSVSLDHPHYRGSLQFVLNVDKKPITLAFFADSSRTTVIENYTFTYRGTAEVYVGVAPDFVADVLTPFAATIGQNVSDIVESVTGGLALNYTNQSSTTSYNNLAGIMQNVGLYRVIATLTANSDYTASLATAVTVAKATIGNVEVPADTLRRQIYGSVAEPTVTIYDAENVRQTNVSYYIYWGNYDTMPTDAGTHAATVIIDDANYEAYQKNISFVINPKAITLDNVKVEDKIIDGTAWINITANLKGILVGDEVGVNLKAHTLGKKTEPGTYGVVISTATLYGLDSGNYVLNTPVYNGSVKLISNVIYAEDAESYVLYGTRDGANYTLSVGEVESSRNKTGVFSSILGKSATMVAFSIRQDGLKVELTEPVQVYIKIPDRYLEHVDLRYSGAGNLAGANIQFTREGDYISFYTTVSGEIVFETTTFPYGVILVASGLLILIVGLMMIWFLDPARKKVGFSGIKRITPVDEAYRKLEEEKRRINRKPPKT